MSAARLSMKSLLLAVDRHAGEVALDVGDEHGDAGLAESLGHELQRAGLAGTGGARDEAVAVEHRERDAHLG